MSSAPQQQLRRGWTTGACATGAAKAAFSALATGQFPDPVEISLPKGGTTSFALATQSLATGSATAGIIKDAGDDPDVTHGALVSVTISPLQEGRGIVFTAGSGVGTVTRPGLPIPPGEPAINPVPRKMISDALREVSAISGLPVDVEVCIAIENGEQLAERTLNGRLGIVGGLSVLGTTGIVKPFSCAAWIASIHRGIDVARATGLDHVVGATGSTSEDAVRSLYNLDDSAFLDMGDFAGGLLKYLRQHPLPRLTMAGGFAKFSKLAQGELDLHSARSRVDFLFLETLLKEAGATEELQQQARTANTAMEVLGLSQAAGIDISSSLAQRTKAAVRAILRDAPVELEVLIVDRQGTIIGRAEFGD